MSIKSSVCHLISFLAIMTYLAAYSSAEAGNAVAERYFNCVVNLENVPKAQSDKIASTQLPVNEKVQALADTAISACGNEKMAAIDFLLAHGDTEAVANRKMSDIDKICTADIAAKIIKYSARLQ